MSLYCSWLMAPRWIVVEDEASVARSPLGHFSPMLMIQYAPGWRRRLSALEFVDFVREFLRCLEPLDPTAAKKGHLSPSLENLIQAHGLISDLYTRPSLTFRRVPILVLLDRPDNPIR
jgi:hypothetical protein